MNCQRHELAFAMNCTFVHELPSALKCGNSFSYIGSYQYTKKRGAF